MCGIFGAVRCSDPEHGSLVVQVVLALGVHSEERGTDSSGLAVSVAEHSPRDATAPTQAHVSQKFSTLDRTFVVKNTGKFSNLPVEPYREVMENAHIFLGHTRAATQGDIKNLANASPLYVGGLIGTHNGDINTKSVPRHKELKKFLHGETDTEYLYLALALGARDRRKMTKVLRTVEGRASLAFFDRTRPDRLYLARTALSPLCYTHDQYGNFYYASNPDWFRRISASNPEVVFKDIILVPEGHLVTVSTLTGTVEDTRRFTPTTRESDLRLLNSAVYRGFIAEDKTADLALHRHLVKQTPLKKWPTPTPAPTPTRTRAYSIFNEEPGSKVDDRESARVPDVWETTVDDYDPTLDDTGNAILDAYNRIDWEDVEDMCWAGGQFDHHTFEKIFSADEETALMLIDDLREEAGLAAFRDKQTETSNIPY